MLGVLDGDERQLVLADIPGLIEGASAGAGLGHEFLAHIERTQLLVHVLDSHPVDGSNPETNHEAVELELTQHNPRLAELPRILALSKGDLVDEETRERLRRHWAKRLGPQTPVVVTSAATGLGLPQLTGELLRLVPGAVEEEEPAATAVADGDQELTEYRVFRPGGSRGYEVSRTGDHTFDVTGAGVERLMARFDLDNEEALAYLEGRLKAIGVIDALEAQGFEPGDDVVIGGVAFELDPGN